MTPDRFQVVEALFHDALEREPAERMRYLEQACGPDRELRSSVEALLKAEPASGRLRELVESTAALAAPVSLIGQRVGAYRILREVGHGGMGAVYLAVRADDAYQKQVAIKFVRAGWTSGYIQQRFQAERQILANLEHPYIARLLDGGTAFDGRPYLVMEYVEGLPITEFAKRWQPDVAARVRLFRRISEAVQYAHQHLVVHRDLKPANIMIREDGVPKLLDFGIAKLLDVEGAEEATQGLGWRPLTPGYASPEQFREERITTAADIYSLGAILYGLLAGQPPYQLERKTAAEAERIVTSEEPPRPSLRNPALGGRLGRDLDTITLKCLRKTPAERYAGVGDLMSDLDGALEGRRIAARNYSAAERALQFLERHRAMVAAGVLIAASLVGGTVVAVREAAWAAASERKAEQRRQDEHRLSAQVLLGISDSLGSVPGATMVRSQALQAATESLDRLAGDARANDQLRLDLARAYTRLGEILGQPGATSRGDLAGALAAYSKAQGIVERLLAAGPRAGPPREQLCTILSQKIMVLSYLGRHGEAQDTGERAIAVARGLLAESPGSAGTLELLGVSYEQMLTAARDFPDRTAVLRLAPLARQVFQQLAARNPPALDPRLNLATAISQEASAKLFLGDVHGAMADGLESLRIREQLRKEFPGNTKVLSGLMYAYGRLGDIGSAEASQGKLPDYRQALEYFQKAHELAAVLARDTADQNAQLNLAISLNRMAEAFGNLRQDRQAAGNYAKSNEILERLVAADARNQVSQVYRMVNYLHLAYHERMAGRRESALRDYQAALGLSEAWLWDDPNGLAAATFMNAKMALALDAAERGDPVAEQWVAEGLKKIQQFAAAKPGMPFARVKPAIAMAKAGVVYEALGQKAAARDHYSRAVVAFQQAPPGRVSNEDRDAIRYAQGALRK